MNPTLYDVLGVSRDASREEIRAAWRAAADRFEPGEGGATAQFRLFNEAAEVLLDPVRRAEYDARLGGGGADEPGGEPGDTAVDPAVVPGPPMPGTARAATMPVTAAATSPDPADPEQPATVRRAVPTPILVAMAVVTALAVGLAGYLTSAADRAEAYERALGRAPAAAENAAVAVLSYDYRSLEADRDAAAKFLTPSYREEYVDTFDALVVDNATQSRTTVEAEVLASSAMTVTGDRDPGRVNVLLFVDQATSTATESDVSVALNRVRFEMVEVDGTWLVDDITSY